MYVGGKFFFNKNYCIVIKDNDIDHSKLGNKLKKKRKSFQVYIESLLQRSFQQVVCDTKRLMP